MSLTVSSLIDEAIANSYGVSGSQKISKPMLLGELNHQDTIIVQMISQIAPDLLAAIDGSETVTDAENKTGYTLEAGIHYRNFTHVKPDDDEYDAIMIVQRQWSERENRHPAAMVSLSGSTGVLYPIDPSGKRWQGDGTSNWFRVDDEIHYSYVPAPGGLTALSDTLTSPDMARQALIASLELSIAIASPTATQGRVEAALAKRRDAFDSLRWQVYKYVHPQGERPSADRPSDAGWLESQIGG